MYDIRKECVGPLCYDFSDADEYLNSPGEAGDAGGSRLWVCQVTRGVPYREGAAERRWGLRVVPSLHAIPTPPPTHTHTRPAPQPAPQPCARRWAWASTSGRSATCSCTPASWVGGARAGPPTAPGRRQFCSSGCVRLLCLCASRGAANPALNSSNACPCRPAASLSAPRPARRVHARLWRQAGAPAGGRHPHHDLRGWAGLGVGAGLGWGAWAGGLLAWGAALWRQAGAPA